MSKYILYGIERIETQKVIAVYDSLEMANEMKDVLLPKTNFDDIKVELVNFNLNVK
jgi:hypothetical protein